MQVATQSITCCDCPTTANAKPAKTGGVKTPMRWRKIEGGFRCPKCQQSKFMGRSIRLRIVGPHESEPREREEMYRALNAASADSNRFANWYLQRLLAADTIITSQIVRRLEVPPHRDDALLSQEDRLEARTKRKNNVVIDTAAKPVPAAKEKFPPMPAVEWYAEATKLFPACAPSSLVQQARMVAAYYGKERFAALVAMKQNVRSYRWDGLPVVVNAQAWKLVRIDGDKIVLRAQIGPGKSWTLSVFAQGEDLARMRQIADGEIIAGTAVFVRRAREPRPGETKRVRVWYLRISAQVPRPTKAKKERKATKTMTLRHDKESLLYGVVDDEAGTIFDYPACELRKSVVKFERLDRRRQIDNSHRAQSMSRRKAKRWAQDRTAACAKRVERVKAEIALCAATLIRQCQAAGVDAVDYDVTPRGFLDTFPYYALAARIKTSLENAGIAVHLIGESSTGNAIDIPGESQVAFAGPGCETGAKACT